MPAQPVVPGFETAGSSGPATFTPYSATNPVPVVVSGGALPTGVYSGQAKIATGGTAVQLPSQALSNGVIVKAKATNTGNIFVGASGITNTDDGTGNGFRLTPGESISYGVSNLNALYINGATAGDAIYWTGN